MTGHDQTPAAGAPEPVPVPAPPPVPSPPSTHNAGTNEDKRAAMKAMAGYAQSITFVAVTTIAFTIGLISNVHHPHWIGELQSGWVLLLVSVFFAFLTIGQYASQLARGIIKPRQGVLEVLLLFGWLSLMAGLALVTLFGFHNIGNG